MPGDLLSYAQGAAVLYMIMLGGELLAASSLAKLSLLVRRNVRISYAWQRRRK